MSEKDDNSNVVEFVPADAYERELAMSGELSRLAAGDKPAHVPRQISRKKVVMAFQDAFEMIGGVQRLAVWANDHPTEFYRLYGKLLPSQSSEALGESKELVVRHVLPRGPLDQEPEK